jgi:predicted PurR-regulated permease PerM
VLSVLLIFMLIAASFWVLRPFLLAIVWAAMIAVATWPLMLKLQARCAAARSPCSSCPPRWCSCSSVPMVLAINTLVENADTIKHWGTRSRRRRFPPPPEWVLKIPFAGARIAETWTEVAARGQQGSDGAPRAARAAAAQWLLDALGSAASSPSSSCSRSSSP